MDRLAKGARISGASREEIAGQFAEGYRAGASIRALAARSGRSYGFVQTLLGEAGVELRSRGGAHHRVRARSTEPASDRAGDSQQLPVLVPGADADDHRAAQPHKAKKKHKSGKKHTSGKKDKSGKKHKSGKKDKSGKKHTTTSKKK